MREADPLSSLVPARSGLLHSTTAGHLSLHTLSSSSSPVAAAPLRRRLPTNLTCFAPLSDSSFAYAGQEVDLSVWDTERAFASSGADKVEEKTTTVEGGKKRKKGVQLLPGETWRAQNVRSITQLTPLRAFPLFGALKADRNNVHLSSCLTITSP